VDKIASASYWVKTGSNLAYTLGTVSIGDNKIIDVAAGTVATDGVNLEQVQNLVDGVDWKDSAELATTGNITLSGEQTIDGVLTSTSRVFVWQQSDATENGIYTTGSGGWTRTTDASTGEEIVSMRIPIGSGGSTLANTQYINTNTAITLGSTNITFITNASVVDHNSTTAKQGGTSSEFYHLTQADYDAITDANAQLSALHTDGSPTFGSIDTTGNLTLSGNTDKQIQMTSLTAWSYFLSSESNDFTINDGTDDFIALIYDATATDKKISLMDGTLTLTKGGTAILSILVGGGNKIAYADNDGIIRQMAYGGGLLFDGTTLTASGTNSNTNTGDQTSIVGITGTVAQFNTALSDGSFATGGGTKTLNWTLTKLSKTI